MKCIVYRALVRPNLIYGVPREYFYLAGFCSIIVWIASNNILLGFLSMIIWLPLGYMWARVDPDFMGIYIAKYLRIKPNFVAGKKQYFEIVVALSSITTGLVTQSFTIGVMSILFWIGIYIRFSDQGHEYQA